MALKCAICGNDKTVEVVCHHCGKPLCEKHRILRSQDRAFITPWYKRPLRSLLNLLRRLRGQEIETLTAVHCATCSNKHHAWLWQ